MVDSSLKPAAFTSRRARRPVFLVKMLVSLLAFSSLLALPFVLGPPRVYFPFEHASIPASDTFQHLRLSKFRPDLRFSSLAYRVAAKKKARKSLRIARINALTDNAVTSYAEWHAYNRHNSNTRRLIWVGSANKYGFGDRFRGIIYAYLCAVLSNRLLILKWDDPFNLNLIFQPTDQMDVFFNPQLDGDDFKVCAEGLPTIHGTCAERNESQLNVILPFAGHPNCYCTLDSLGLLKSQLPIVVLRSEYPPSIRSFFQGVLENEDTLPYYMDQLGTLARDWSSPNSTRKYGKNSRPTRDDDAMFFAQIFKAILRPSPQFLRFLARQPDIVRSFIPNRLFGAPPNKRRRHISIHARLGIGLNETERYPQRFNYTRTRQHIIAACMAGHAAEMADEQDLHEPQRFYVATDTPGFVPVLKSELEKRSKNPIVVEGVHEKAHSNTLRTGNERDKEIFMETMADIFFLAAGEGIVSLPSGFANLAQWFSGKPHRAVRVRRCVKEEWEKSPSEYVNHLEVNPINESRK